MLFQMAPLALTWSDLERSKSRSSIFQRAVSWKRLKIGPWLPLKLIVTIVGDSYYDNE